MWSENYEHRKDTEWFTAVKDKFAKVNQQEDMRIDKERLRKILGKLQPWKEPGHDGVQGFWYKRFTSLYERLVIDLSNMLNSGSPPTWMT